MVAMLDQAAIKAPDQQREEREGEAARRQEEARVLAEEYKVLDDQEYEAWDGNEFGLGPAGPPPKPSEDPDVVMVSADAQPKGEGKRKEKSNAAVASAAAASGSAPSHRGPGA